LRIKSKIQKRKRKQKIRKQKIFHGTEENTRKNLPQILREEFCFIDLMKWIQKHQQSLLLAKSIRRRQRHKKNLLGRCSR